MVKCVCEQCGKEFETHACYLKRGGGRFCSKSCSTIYRNLNNNPTKDPEVRRKISENHADFSGEKNPMFGKRGETAPSYIDGRNKFKGGTYRKILLASGKEAVCSICGKKKNLHVHHIDGNHKNNDLSNLTWLCQKCHHTIAHQRYRDELGRFVGAKLNEKVEF